MNLIGYGEKCWIYQQARTRHLDHGENSFYKQIFFMMNADRIIERKTALG